MNEGRWRPTRVARTLAGLSPLRLRREIDHLSSAIEDVRLHLERRSDEVGGLIGEVRASLEAVTRFEHDSRADRILATMLWVEAADISDQMLVSVITATWNRASALSRAIQSVVAQSYQTWEMLVVDDGSSDATTPMVEAIGDSRVRLIRVEHGGAARARNRGLMEARGQLVAYLDSDNTMHRHWLRSVVWAFREHPDIDVAYGAHVRELDRLIANTQDLGLPALMFHPFDRRRLEEYSYIDLGSVAHRAKLAAASFDETFSVADDYDLILRLTRDKPALALPVQTIRERLRPPTEHG